MNELATVTSVKDTMADDAAAVGPVLLHAVPVHEKTAGADYGCHPFVRTSASRAKSKVIIAVAVVLGRQFKGHLPHSNSTEIH